MLLLSLSSLSLSLLLRLSPSTLSLPLTPTISLSLTLSPLLYLIKMAGEDEYDPFYPALLATLVSPFFVHVPSHLIFFSLSVSNTRSLLLSHPRSLSLPPFYSTFINRLSVLPLCLFSSLFPSLRMIPRGMLPSDVRLLVGSPNSLIIFTTILTLFLSLSLSLFLPSPLSLPLLFYLYFLYLLPSKKRKTYCEPGSFESPCKFCCWWLTWRCPSSPHPSCIFSSPPSPRPWCG